MDDYVKLLEGIVEKFMADPIKKHIWSEEEINIVHEIDRKRKLRLWIERREIASKFFHQEIPDIYNQGIQNWEAQNPKP